MKPRALIVLLPLLALGCSPMYVCDGSETYCVDETPVIFDKTIPDAYRGDALIEARIGAQLGASLAYWRVAHAQLSGWRIVYTAGLITCAGDPATGCFSADDRTITLTFYAPQFAPGCVEDSALPHEIGHFVSDHEGAAWCDFSGPWAEMLAQPECAPLAHAEPYANPLFLWYSIPCRATWRTP
jgi:hypothetical protein